MKTVVIVLNTSWNIYNFRLNLMKALRTKGFNVIALAPYDEYSDKLQEAGFEWVHLPLDNDSTNPLKELFQIRSFYKIYKEISPDIILQYTVKPNLYGTFAAQLLKIPVINNISGLGTVFVKDKLVYKVARGMYRLVLRFPQKVFFQNRHDHALFLQQKLVKAHLSDVIPGSGIDVSRFVPIPYPKENEDSVKFLMIARLIKDKGLIEYIEAIKVLKKRYTNVTFQLIGSLYEGNPSSISKDILDSWIKDDLIEYLSFSDKMEEIISKVDCVVLPSYREGLSRVLLEAASMAKPIVTTDVAGCKDVVDDGVNGFLCKVKDVPSLVEAMEKIIALKPEQLEEMSRKGREKIVSEFDEKIVINKYLYEVENILNQECHVNKKLKSL